MPSRDEESSRRKKSREADSPRSKESRLQDKTRTKSSRKLGRRQISLDRERSRDRALNRLSRASISNISGRDKEEVTVKVPEMDRRSSTGDTRSSAYPTFSKAHSREAVGSREEIGKLKASELTPDATDVGKETTKRAQTRQSEETRSASRAPPSPPLTSDEGDLNRANSAGSSRRSTDVPRPTTPSGRKSADHGSRDPASRIRGEHRTSPRKSSRLDVESDGSGKTEGSRPSTAKRTAAMPHARDSPLSALQGDGARDISVGSHSGSNVMGASTDSQATSIAPDTQDVPTPPRVATPGRPVSQGALYIKSQTPVNGVKVSPAPQQRPVNPGLSGPFPSMTPMNDLPFMQPPQPPPPPAMDLDIDTPRVDYLLHNGGLPYLLPRSLIPSTTQPPIQSYQQYASPRAPQGVGSTDVAQVFAPISKRLEDFGKVLSKNGSLAVATGYRSVARRLLDRLEHVFARNISSEKCECVMCHSRPHPGLSDEEDAGVSWGEILEFVSGRRELPQWPPFSLNFGSTGLGISGDAHLAPMQKLDPDVPEQYREHYLQQNDKTKKTVQNWLEAQSPDLASSPPQDVDDETLSFAMLTRLDASHRPLFAALMKGQSTVAASRASTPVDGASIKNEVLPKTALALQRLYRLPVLPRDPECTIYLLNNPNLHSILATLSAVSPGEWDILVSGRFDGFLWSGAEAPTTQHFSPSASRAPSRGPTPFLAGGIPYRGSAFSPLRNVSSPTRDVFPNLSRGPTPAPSTATAAGGLNGSAPAPVQMDEETEIAVLAEVEREIFRGMELLEDQFELVHQQAESLRQRLRSRAAGLALAAQVRRGSLASDVEVRTGTPASIIGGWGSVGGTPGIGGGRGVGRGGEDIEGLLDDNQSLAPDDSASNISYARRRRPKRTDRRTPASVAEEEGNGVGGDRRRRR